MNVDLLGLSGTGLAVSPTSGTGFVTPSLPFKVSKIIEASKRFGRGYKPRPAWNHIATN